MKSIFFALFLPQRIHLEMRTRIHNGDEALLAAAVCDAIALKKNWCSHIVFFWASHRLPLSSSPVPAVRS